MTAEEWHKMDTRYRVPGPDGPVICECPDCKSTDLVQVGWVDDRKREKLLECRACGTRF